MKRTLSIGLLSAAALIHTTANAACVPSNNTRCNVEMGLDLIDGKEDFSYYYLFDGAGVDIYIVDSGFVVNATAPAVQAEFGNRYTNSDFVTPGNWVNTSNNHGYKMAEAAGGATKGVASGANIRQVRVNVDGADSDNSSLKAALTWLKTAPLQQQSVISISQARTYDESVNDLIEEVVRRGFPVFVSAGNGPIGGGGGGSGVDACGSTNGMPALTPASEPSAFTVSAGSVGLLGGRENYANYGVCVDGFAYAPLTTAGGTSQATARAAGVAALIWQQHPNLNGAEVIEEMIKRAQTNEIPLQSYDLSANRAVTSVPIATNPAFFGIRNGLCGGRNTLQWIDSGPGTLYYQLEKSANSQFDGSQVVYEGLNQAHTVYVSSPTYYRVRGCNYRGCNPIEATNANRTAISSPPCQ